MSYETTKRCDRCGAFTFTSKALPDGWTASSGRMDQPLRREPFVYCRQCSAGRSRYPAYAMGDLGKRGCEVAP